MASGELRFPVALIPDNIYLNLGNQETICSTDHIGTH